MHKLTKSRIISGLQCSKKLYLEVFKPELGDVGSATNFYFDIGNQVGEIARQQYPNGNLIGFDKRFEKAIEKTRHFLERYPERPIFEAIFSESGILVMADVFRKLDNGYCMTEVKSSTSVKDYHLLDCAIQSWVIEQAGYPLKMIELAHIDNSFVYSGHENYQGLLQHEDITEKIIELKQEVPGWLNQFQEVLAGDEPSIKTGAQCNSPYTCPYTSYCYPEPAEYPITLLPRGGKVASELLEEGIDDIRDIPEKRLYNENHERVRRVTISGKAEIDPEIGKQMRELPYPRYYLDFETIQFAVPIWAETRPYQQLPFQWSCHIETEPGNLEHLEFLGTSGEAPIRLFIDTLINSLGDSGSIIVYSSFEKSRLNDLIIRYPDLKENIEKIINRLVDILPQVRKYYYHPDMMGSWSIKYVLPTIAPELNYSELEEVQNGTEAQIAFLEAISSDTSEKRKAELVTRLLEYCKLDTLAMVKAVWFFQNNI